MSKKKKKIVLNTVFLLACFCLTLYVVFNDQDLSKIMGYVKAARSGYWAVSAGLVIVFILSESVIIFYLMRSLGEKPRLDHCFLYSFVGFFFSLVTPSASGGQPAQVLFMKKDQLPVHLSTLVLLIVTITYKLVLVILGLLVLLLKPEPEMTLLAPIMPWLWLGIALNVLCVGAMLALVFCPSLAKGLVMAVFRFVKGLALPKGAAVSKRLDALEDKLDRSMEGYKKAALYFQGHKRVILNVLLMTFVQRGCLFFITYLVLVSFDVRHVGMVEAVTLQAMISVAVDMLPLPGGMGISEHLFQAVFLPVCGAALTAPVLIVSRGISFYTQLLISAAFTVVAYLRIFRGGEE